MCIIIMKVFKHNRIKKSEIQIMFGAESEEREEIIMLKCYCELNEERKEEDDDEEQEKH